MLLPQLGRHGVSTAALEEELRCQRASGSSCVCFSALTFIRSSLSRSDRRTKAFQKAPVDFSRSI